MTDSGAAEAINTHLQQLGWQAYIPAFTELLSRFDGTEDSWLIPPDSLPECLLAWLQSLQDNPRPLPVALLEVRRWPAIHFRVANSDGQEWDYREESFQAFGFGSHPNPTYRYWISHTRRPPGRLRRAVGFLRSIANGAAGQP